MQLFLMFSVCRGCRESRGGSEGERFHLQSCAWFLTPGVSLTTSSRDEAHIEKSVCFDIGFDIRAEADFILFFFLQFVFQNQEFVRFSNFHVIWN